MAKLALFAVRRARHCTVPHVDARCKLIIMLMYAKYTQEEILSRTV